MNLLCVCMHLPMFCLTVSAMSVRDAGVCFRTQVAERSQSSSGSSDVV